MDERDDDDDVDERDEREDDRERRDDGREGGGEEVSPLPFASFPSFSSSYLLPPSLPVSLERGLSKSDSWEDWLS